MQVLVLNSGISSLKFRVLNVVEGEAVRETNPGQTLVSGAVKDIGGTATLELAIEGRSEMKATQSVPDHHHAIRWLFEHLGQSSGESENSLSGVETVGHRVSSPWRGPIFSPCGDR